MKLRQRQTRFKVLVVDCPWKFDDALGKRGADANYACEYVDWLKAYELPPLADDCVLFMWKLASLQEEAFQVARAWGFVPNKGELVWHKLTKNGKTHFGMGRTVRSSHESCVIAKRGRPPLPLLRNQRSLFSAKMPIDANGRYVHSAKPDEFFEIVRSLYDGPRASVFERKQRDGFVCFGDQLEEGIY